jgi:hypothetical protein
MESGAIGFQQSSIADSNHGLERKVLRADILSQNGYQIWMVMGIKYGLKRSISSQN